MADDCKTISKNKTIKITLWSLLFIISIVAGGVGLYWKTQMAIASSEAFVYEKITKEVEVKYVTRKVVDLLMKNINNKIQAQTNLINAKFELILKKI